MAYLVTVKRYVDGQAKTNIVTNYNRRERAERAYQQAINELKHDYPYDPVNETGSNELTDGLQRQATFVRIFFDLEKPKQADKCVLAKVSLMEREE